MSQAVYHNYIFLAVDKKIHGVAKNELTAYKKAAIRKITETKAVTTYAYTTLGFKANTVLMLWFHSDTPEKMQSLLNDLMHTHLGNYLAISYTLFGMTRKSVYSAKPQGNNVSLNSKPRLPYLIIYPFTKTKGWYLLDREKRKALMAEHMKIGSGYRQIRQLLLYAFGIDDHEFIVSYETASLEDFQTLVMDLRASQARLYTLNDTPIFTCIYQPLERVFDFL